MGRLVVVLALGLSLVGCGDDRKDPAAASSSTTTAATAPESTTTTSAPTTTTEPGLSEASGLRFDGIGPIKVGMTLAEATAAVGKPVTVNPDYVLDGCAYARVEGGPEGLSFMVLRDNDTDPWRIVRVNVGEKSRIATLSGVRIGATEAEVKSTYSGPGKTGTIAVTGHEYVEAGHYITYDVTGPRVSCCCSRPTGRRSPSSAPPPDPVGYVEGCA